MFDFFNQSSYFYNFKVMPKKSKKFKQFTQPLKIQAIRKLDCKHSAKRYQIVTAVHTSLYNEIWVLVFATIADWIVWGVFFVHIADTHIEIVSVGFVGIIFAMIFHTGAEDMRIA
jgi:hypothetical protein